MWRDQIKQHTRSISCTHNNWPFTDLHSVTADWPNPGIIWPSICCSLSGLYRIISILTGTEDNPPSIVTISTLPRTSLPFADSDYCTIFASKKMNRFPELQDSRWSRSIVIKVEYNAGSCDLHVKLLSESFVDLGNFNNMYGIDFKRTDAFGWVSFSTK